MIHVIHPYSVGSSLVFDDAPRGLFGEGLIGGTDLILRIIASLVGANQDKFTLIFSEKFFPGAKVEAEWIGAGEAGSGNWYRVNVPGVIENDGWLCDALLKYFPKPPKKIHFQIKPYEREK